MIAIPREELFNSSFTKIEFDAGLKLPTTETSKQFTKRVCFAEHDEEFEIPHVNDLSDDDIERVWMSEEDFKTIRKECRMIILAIERECTNILAGVELRGLEHHMSTQRKQKQAVREILYGTVEKLQCFQDETNMDVSDMMGEMCQKVSSRSEKMAHRIALGDAVEAKA